MHDCRDKVPTWSLSLLQWLMAIVYFYAGVAKVRRRVLAHTHVQTHRACAHAMNLELIPSSRVLAAVRADERGLAAG
jgi:hypothetical protein